MALRILFFASLKERSGVNRFELEPAHPLTVINLKSQLGELYPAIKPLLPNCLVAINQQFAFNDDPVPENAEVAFFPPVSGGSSGPTVLKIVEGALDLNELVASITLPTTGAACIFTGMVRGQTQRDDPHETVSLEYEAYKPMAEAKMAQ
ncbi:MAG TPA: MoaD/ThiS family protein, partial [Anaerolineaceae bacterium]|nr:MoaD/ThiS family protein [Anaerolineaceae bacterium]